MHTRCSTHTHTHTHSLTGSATTEPVLAEVKAYEEFIALSASSGLEPPCCDCSSSDECTRSAANTCCRWASSKEKASSPRPKASEYRAASSYWSGKCSWRFVSPVFTARERLRRCARIFECSSHDVSARSRGRGTGVRAPRVSRRHRRMFLGGFVRVRGPALDSVRVLPVRARALGRRARGRLHLSWTGPY